jgi:cytochrome c556
MGHKVTLEDKSLEEIVNNRMALMQKVKSTSSQIFRLLKNNDYEAILELNETLLHAASEFKDHYPEGSQHKGASEAIWLIKDDPDNPEKVDTFLEFNNKFVSDIEMISLSAELEDNEMLNDAFKEMAANCGSCHKKFRN